MQQCKPIRAVLSGGACLRQCYLFSKRDKR